MSAMLSARVARIPRELKLFTVAMMAMGVSYSLFDSIYNNYMNDRFALSGFERSILEFPRELPGFLVVFVSALLWFLCSRRLGSLTMALGMVGALLIGFASSSYALMLIWLFVYSMGQHMFMPLSSTIGMELAHEGHVGRRLGQLNALRNLAAIGGSLIVIVGFRYLNLTYEATFVLVAVGLGLAAYLMYSMERQQTQRPGRFLQLHREYRLYYLLAVLFGSRKQLFMTFAPWVLVTVYHQPPETLATLLLIGGVIGILFQPILGRAIDQLGERFVLASEAVLLVVVCLGYGFGGVLFSEHVAFLVACTCYLLDQMLMSVGMARSTYMKKIARQPADIQPALTAAVTIDHVFSISVALLGGLVWSVYGYQYVFFMGMVIAAVNFVVALQVRIPPATELPALQELAAPRAEPRPAG